MANTIELKVPDLGGSHDVPVIEILVKVGDTVAKDQSLITLESDKATMPSASPGSSGIARSSRRNLRPTLCPVTPGFRWSSPRRCCA